MGDYQYNYSSDIKLKENIKPLHNILEKIDLLTPITYILKDGSTKRILGDRHTERECGFIAQEVENIFPECVYSHENPEIGEERFVLDYQYFSTISVAGIQELADKVDKLKDEMKLLKKNN
tara:strand:+ start:1236 stop:1598 length:363 start_codon:yes stop_codon:yes gene_type:complete